MTLYSLWCGHDWKGKTMELTAVRVQERVQTTTRIERMDFNAFVRRMAREGRAINGDREEFYDFCSDIPGDGYHTSDEWHQYWRAFCEWQDAHDLHETQLEALAA